MTPLASIVIPTHARPQLLRRAVETAIAQSIAEVEVVVVDDGSPEPVDLPDHPKLRVIRHDRSRGGSAARNTGTQAARGRFISYLDDDDELRHDHLAVALATHERTQLPPPVGVLTGIEVVDPDGETFDVRMPPTLPRGAHFALEEPQPGCSFGTKQTLVVETEVIRHLGGWDEAFRSRVHTELFLRLNPICSLHGVEVPTYRLLEHRGPRVSKDPDLRQRSFRQLREKHGAAFEAHPRGAARLLVDHTRQSWRDGRRAAAARAFAEAVRGSPVATVGRVVGHIRSPDSA